MDKPSPLSITNPSLTPSNSTSDMSAQIEAIVSSHKVVLFMKGTPAAPYCGFSARAVALLQEAGADIFAVNVLEDNGFREGIKQFTNWPTIPQAFISGEFVGGCDILTEMAESGELAKALG
jgi:monothiol glutaredoxin